MAKQANEVPGNVHPEVYAGHRTKKYKRTTSERPYTTSMCSCGNLRILLIVVRCIVAATKYAIRKEGAHAH